MSTNMQNTATATSSCLYTTNGIVDPIINVAEDREASFQLLVNTRSSYKEMRQERDLSVHTATWHPWSSTRAKYATIAANLDLHMAQMRATCLDSVNRIEQCDEIMHSWDRNMEEIDSCMDHLAAEELKNKEERAHDFYEESYYESEFSGGDVTVSPTSFSTVHADPCDEVMRMTIGLKGANFSAITAASNVSIIWHEKDNGIIYIRSHDDQARAHAIRLICEAMKYNREIINARRSGIPFASDRVRVRKQQ